MKKIIVFAGPNGSGKSTIVAKQLNTPGFPKKYICPDIVVKRYSNIPDIKKRYIKAMRDCEKLRYEYIRNGVSFSFETVFSSKNKLDFLIYAKKQGYLLEGIYVTTKDPRINIDRVRQRFESGGHNVPIKKIVLRYQESMSMLPYIINICDSITVIDNSDSTPIIVFSKYNNKLYLLNKEKRNDGWINEFIVKPLNGFCNINVNINDLTVSETEMYFRLK